MLQHVCYCVQAVISSHLQTVWERVCPKQLQ